VKPSTPALAVALILNAHSALCGTCTTYTVGRDPAASDTLVVEYLSRSVGQVFAASDTLLASLTVWRPAIPALDSAPRHLFIVDVDSAGAPIPTSIVLDGGSIVNFTGDGIHQVPYRFQFNPPAVLPHRGRYCLVVPFDQCLGAISILASDDDPLGVGKAWRIYTNNFANCAYPSGLPSPMFPPVYVIFQAEFCNATLAVGPPVDLHVFQLLAPSPNPSRGTSEIHFLLPLASAVEVNLFDVAGRRVWSWLSGADLPAGPHTITWDGRDASGAPARSGLYTLRARAGCDVGVRKLLIQR
jgi:hypothetical protein